MTAVVVLPVTGPSTGSAAKKVSSGRSCLCFCETGTKDHEFCGVVTTAAFRSGSKEECWAPGTDTGISS